LVLSAAAGDVAVAQDAVEGTDTGYGVAALALLLGDDHRRRRPHVAHDGLAA